MKFAGILQRNKKIYTKNMVPGIRVYDEQLINVDGIEYRHWNPNRSKLAAAVHSGISQIGIKPSSTVLYLGASTGTTISHVSDMIGLDGFVFGVEFSPRVTRELVFLSKKRKNLAPILADANRPMDYLHRIFKVDSIFQDIAQKDQVEIFHKNMKMFLRKGGFGILALKARSFDVTKRPKQVFKQVRGELEKFTTIVDYRELSPFEKDHALYVVKW